MSSQFAEEEEQTNTVTRTRIGVMTYLAPKNSLISSEALEEVNEAVNTCIDNREVQIVIDMTAVEVIHSPALEALLDLQNLLVRHGGWLKVAQINKLVKEIFYITGLDELISIIDMSTENDRRLASKNTSDSKQRLGDILIERELITKKKLEQIIASQTKGAQRLGRMLIDKGLVSERDMMLALSEQLRLPFANLRVGMYDPEIAELLSKDIAARLKVLPLFRIKDKLFVATSDPQAIPSFDEIEERTSYRVSPVLAQQENIIKVINEAHAGNSLTSDLIYDVEGEFEIVDEQLTVDVNAIDEMAAGSPIINMVNSIIQRAIHDKASDIHIESSRGKSRVRYRIDGLLYEVMTIRSELHPAMASRLKVMANLDISERRMPQDGRIQVHTQGRSVDLRFSSLPGLYGEKIVLRVLDKNQSILDVNKLGIREPTLATFLKLLKRTHGLILVTGPTGSGKTTSLYAALNYLNSIEKNIVTIEDPVEYQIDIINQNEVKQNIGLSFSKILKHVLRQDPDIIMVGEIREQETAEIAVQAALTGHLVLSTLHTNDSVGAVTRMIEMGVEPYLLSSALIGVVAQRLIRKICPTCRTTFVAPPEMVARYGWQVEGTLKLARGRGCPECYDSGYRGRAGIHEILDIDQRLQSLIMRNPSRDDLTNYLVDRDIRTLFNDGIEVVKNGQTTIEEIARVINY